MTPGGIRIRAEAHAWNKILSDSMRYKVSGFLIFRNINFRDTLTFTIQSYISTRSHVNVDECSISNLRSFCHMTFFEVIKVMRGAHSQSSVEGAVRRLEEFRRLRVPPKKIVEACNLHY